MAPTPPPCARVRASACGSSPAAATRGSPVAAITASGAARGDWIVLLNDDAVADSDAVAELMATAGDRPEVGMLACRVVSYEFPNLIDSAGLLFYPDGVCRSRGWEEKDLGQYDDRPRCWRRTGCRRLSRC